MGPSTSRSWLPVSVAGGGRPRLKKTMFRLTVWLYGTPGAVIRTSKCFGRCDLRTHIRRVVKVHTVAVGGDTPIHINNKENKKGKQ